MLKRLPLTPVVLLCVAGFSVGFAVRKGFFAGLGKAVDSPPAGEGKAPERVRANSVTPSLVVPHLVSTDTLETLRDDDAPDFYARAALWMNGASAEDLQKFWDGMKNSPVQRRDLMELLMLHWTRLDPQAAIAASAGSWYPTAAWETWAANDPEAALAAARQGNTLQVTYVSWGIGKFHPGWLRDHLAEIPVPGLDNAFTGLAQWSHSSDPEAEIRFLWENGQNFSQETFRHLIQDDPMQAYAWIQDHGMAPYAFKGGSAGALGEVADALVKSHPDDLQKIIAAMPEGEDRRQMEGAAFRDLLSRDPAAALEQAKQTAGPLVAAEQLAMAGKALADTDPDAALDAMNRMLTVYPDALMPYRVIGDGSLGASSAGPSFQSAMDLGRVLLAQDPAHLLELPAMQSSNGQQAIAMVAQQWADKDPDAVCTWAIDHVDTPNDRIAVNAAANSLMKAGRIEDAANLAVMTVSTAPEYVAYVYQSWIRSDATAANRWLDGADLPDSSKEAVRNPPPH